MKEEKTKREEGNMSEIYDYRETHPSFGHVQVNRTQSSKSLNLFGSPVLHNEMIVMTISGCAALRGLHETNYYSREDLIKIAFSSVQFADLITQMNARGTPCTIIKIANQPIEDCPEQKPVELMQKEFDDEMKELKTYIMTLSTMVKEVLDATRIPKGKKDEIIKIVERMGNKLKHTYPFIANQFARQMDNTVAAAKAEIDAFVLQEIRAARTTGEVKKITAHMPEKGITSEHGISPIDELRSKFKKG